jgi:hypothetical protein
MDTLIASIIAFVAGWIIGGFQHAEDKKSKMDRY